MVDLRCPCPGGPLAGRLSRRAALRAAGLAAASLAAGGARIPAAAQDATPAGTPPASVLPDLTGVAPLPLTDERRAQFEAYVADALLRFGVPGASIAVVQNGDVVYLNGFGVRAAGSTQAVDPDTMLMIGSVTKSMTTMLAATLVDDGRLTWETRLIDLLPAFAVGDPVLTESLSVRDAFCNCIGIPGRDIELFFEGDAFTPEGVVTALADVAPTAARGERFQYNNLLIGAGGYAVGVAAEGSSDSVLRAYDIALRERVLGPIGMTRSTFWVEEVLAGGNYALPHATDLTERLQAIPLAAERSVLPAAPAGALWSNAREMARYVQTELAHGVAPNGTRVVSAEHLAETWAPGVALPSAPGPRSALTTATTGYGLGWGSGDYLGQRLISHSGGTFGFASEVAFLPEANLGLVVLSNARTLGSVFPYAVQFRLLELLFDQEAASDAELSALVEMARAASGVGLGAVDPAAVTPYLGRYGNPKLGGVTLSMRGDRLVLDVGEHSSELRPGADTSGEAAHYLMVDPPLSLLSEGGVSAVSFAGAADGRPRLRLAVAAGPTGPEQVFVFAPVDATETASG